MRVLCYRSQSCIPRPERSTEVEPKRNFAATPHTEISKYGLQIISASSMLRDALNSVIIAAI